MKNSKHTPGPWVVAISERILFDRDTGHRETYPKCVILAGKQTIALLVPPIHTNYKSDAQLLAAAPELLETLKSFYDSVLEQTGGPLPWKELENAKKLLDKLCPD